MGRILIVEDDDGIRETFRRFLERKYQVVAVDSAERAFRQVTDFVPEVVLTDVQLPGMDGLELLGKLREALPELDVIVMTGHEDMRTAIGAMKAGAYDYLVKPLGLDELEVVIQRCFHDRSVRRRLRQLQEEASETYSINQIVGRSPPMIEIYKLIGTLVGNRAPVFIRGETGTGKELIARAIHYNSPYGAEPFIAVNCTEMPETLLESELFGHMRGAFTGAVDDRRGRFELAGSGTIFLDEIGDTTPAFQTKLLRVLQEREYYPVGSERPRRTEARVIAATNQDVEKLVRQGKFREDLYFRLKVVEIRVPPLRERPQDIPMLVEHLLRKISKNVHKDVFVVPEEVVRFLTSYEWPGNVRELENALTRAVVLARGPAIARDDLALTHDLTREGTPGPLATDDLTLAGAERAQIERVLRINGGNKRQSARVLGISRPRLDRLLSKYEIAVPNRSRSGNEA
ncbi:MAG: sigma-54-dependent transcriptional regulator [Longimicrobiales bacterium]